jgi:hypothetical protein
VPAHVQEKHVDNGKFEFQYVSMQSNVGAELAQINPNEITEIICIAECQCAFDII